MTSIQTVFQQAQYFKQFLALEEENTIGYSKERLKTSDFKSRGGVKGVSRKEWVMQKKERHIRKGKETKHEGNTKYTGRKRRPKF